MLHDKQAENVSQVVEIELFLLKPYNLPCHKSTQECYLNTPDMENILSYSSRLKLNYFEFFAMIASLTLFGTSA